MQWIDKYRPRRIDDIAGQGAIKSTIKKFIASGSLPNMLFYGPAGTGKTSCALAIAHEVLGEAFSTNFVKYNASDDRSVDFLRKNIVMATKTLPLNGKPRIILLDEADGILKEGQQLLRSPLESTNRTRLIFTANDLSALIEPLISRLMVFEFKPLTKEDIIKRLKQILNMEHKELDDGALKEITKKSGGDMRRAINLLEQQVYMANAELEELLQRYAR